MNHNEGEFYLIKDRKNYKANQFIGEILKKLDNNNYLLNIYIFPQDTICGKQPHNSRNEVYLTSSQVIYEFKEKNEKKVEVVSLDEYINRKYINNEKLKYPIYFRRQTYSIEKKEFLETLLPICYCREYFNPDYPFKKCNCGKVFHLECLIQNESGKCWSDDCNFDCNSFLTEEQKVQKAKIISGNINTNISEDENIGEDKNNNKVNFLNKKSKRDKKDEIDESKENDENKKKNNITFNNTNISGNNNINELNNQNKENERKIEIIGEEKKREINLKRNKGIDIIYKILLEGLNTITKNLNILKKYDNCKNKEIYNYIKSNNKLLVMLQLRQLSEEIEKNLFGLYGNNINSYFYFLQEFNKCKTDSQDLIIKIIFGEYTPQEISRFRDEDFLSEEQKIQKEKEKNNEINKMKLKNEDNNLKLTLNKGRMLSQQEIFYDDKHNDLNLSSETYFISSELYENNKKEYDKIKEKQRQFPNMKIEDIKMLISLKDPNEENINEKLNKLIQDNFEIYGQTDFFDKREAILKKEAKKIIKNDKNKNKNNNNKNILIDDEDKNKNKKGY